MTIIALLLWLAQANPAAPATAAPPVVTTPSSIDTSVRRAPVAFTPSTDAALIENSGSTNFAGFKIALEPNGSALIGEPSGVRRATVSRATAKWFFSHIAADGPLERVAVTHCLKPVSFGSTTTVAWKGHVTPDLSCGGGPAATELDRMVRAIERQLDVTPQKRGLRYPM